MTAVAFELVPFSKTEEPRRHFEAATADYGHVSAFLLPRIRVASEFYVLRSSLEETDVAAAPETTKRIERANVEGGFAVRVVDNVKQLAAFVRSTLLQDVNTLCIIEDVLARRGDAHLARSRCDLRYIDEAVLYVLSSANDDSEVERCLRASRLTFGHSLCILVRSERLATSTTHEWSRETIGFLVSAAMWAVVSARSGETFLLAKL